MRRACSRLILGDQDVAGFALKLEHKELVAVISALAETKILDRTLTDQQQRIMQGAGKEAGEAQASGEDGLNEPALGILLVVLSSIYLWVLRKGLRTGEMPLAVIPTTWVSRSEQPYMFWVFAAWNVTMFGALLGLGLRELLTGSYLT
jgi:hypothetical protein